MTTPTPPASPAHRGAWRAAVPVMSLAAGLLFGTSAVLADTGELGDEPRDLAELIQARNSQVESLTSQRAALQAQVDQLSDQGPQDVTQVGADQLAPMVGLGAVSGPALRVTLDDAGYTLDTLPEGYTVDDVVVHQQDVQSVVNAMWTGGAEAMMIQDQRIVSTSSVQCVGNTLYLQGRVYSPPYTITAVGDVEGMSLALVGDPVVANYRAWADILGLGYAVEALETAELPAFEGTVRPQHAEILDDADAEAATTG